MWDATAYAWRDLNECLNVARPLLYRALALDDADAMAHFALGYTLVCAGDPEGGIIEVERALSLDPNHAWARGQLGACCCFTGRYSEAIAALRQAMQTSPHDPLTWAWMLWLTCTEFYSGDDEAALLSAERLIRFRPDKPHAYRLRVASLGHLGRTDEASLALQEAKTRLSSPHLYGGGRPPWVRPVDYERVLEGLRKAGWTE